MLQSLRQHTRELHRQTERALDLPRATSSLAEYSLVLRRLLDFYLPLEEQLFHQLPASRAIRPDWENRRKVPSLQADLGVLEAAGALPAKPCAVPLLASGLERVGAWYVVEGATLGGSVIAAQLSRRLGIGPDTGGRFFDVYGALRQRRWEQFCAYLATFPPEDARPVCNGARAVFDALRLWLVRPPACVPAPRAACGPAGR